MYLTTSEAEQIKAHLESIRSILSCYAETSGMFDQIAYMESYCNDMEEALDIVLSNK